MKDEIRTAIMTELTVPLWPTAGRALGLCRNVTYAAAKRGEIPTIPLGRKRPVPTAALRRMLGIEGPNSWDEGEAVDVDRRSSSKLKTSLRNEVVTCREPKAPPSPRRRGRPRKSEAELA